MLTIRNYDVTLKMSSLALEPSSVKTECFERDLNRMYIKHACLEGYAYNFKNIARDERVQKTCGHLGLSCHRSQIVGLLTRVTCKN